MQISRRDWENYINALARIDQTAADAMQYWMDDNPDADTDELIYTASLLSDRYGEAAASLACEMYDRTAAAQGVTIPPAEPAPTATYHETAKAIAGTMKNQRNSVPQTVGRLVKQAGADTMLKNAKRDGAEFAWVPHGDTCSFCLMLASNGWTHATEGVAKGNHAEHIHANCDCTFAVRFDGKSGVKGYDPEKYRRMYEDAEGDTWQEKLNSMRRADYAERRDEINAQKRAAYDKRNEFKSVLEKYQNSSTPGVGELIIPDEREIKNREEVNCRLIYNQFGGNIEMLPEGHEPNKKNPDYLWNAKYWEEQEPTSYTKTAVSRNVREAIHQIAENPGGIVLDIGESPMPIEEIRNSVLSRFRQSAPFDCDLILIRNGKIEEIWHYRKIKR